MKITKYTFDVKGDERGSLIAIEAAQTIPFPIKRIYYIYGTKPSVIRGYHAHIKLEQILICIHGSCKIVLDNGIERVEVHMSKPNEGLYIGALTWREMKEFSEDAVLLVLASEHYKESDYIRDYMQFLNKVKV